MYGQQQVEAEAAESGIETVAPGTEDAEAPEVEGVESQVERANGDGLPPAGWYPDPHAPEKRRYWDGTRWIKPKPTGRANRLAVTALICACLAGVVVGGILGIVFGSVALDEIRESEGKERGEAMAQWAIGLGVVNLVISAVFVALVIAALQSS